MIGFLLGLTLGVVAWLVLVVLRLFRTVECLKEAMNAQSKVNHGLIDAQALCLKRGDLN